MNLEEEDNMRPILRYHGGKWRIAKWIISHIPPHRVYVEPFCGAASVLLRKPPAPTEVINDLNGRLINVFAVMRSPEKAEILCHKLKFTPCSRAVYLEAREQSPDDIEDARRMIILGHQSFGSCGASGGKMSGWRRGIRKDRETSSAQEWSNIYTYVGEWCERLRKVFIESEPAIKIIESWDSDETVFYVDPPYIASTRHGPGNTGYAHEMTDDDHIELAEQLHNTKGFVILSGYNSSLYNELYSGWLKIEKKAFADRGKSTIECLWMSPECNKEFIIKKNGMLF